MAEDEANADDPEDDINAYITWFPRYVVYSDMAGLSSRVRLSQFGSIWVPNQPDLIHHYL